MLCRLHHLQMSSLECFMSMLSNGRASPFNVYNIRRGDYITHRGQVKPVQCLRYPQRSRKARSMPTLSTEVIPSFTEVRLSLFSACIINRSHYIIHRGHVKPFQCLHYPQRSCKACPMPVLSTNVIIQRGQVKLVQCLHYPQRSLYYPQRSTKACSMSTSYRGQAKPVQGLHHTQRSSKVCSMPTSYTEVKLSLFNAHIVHRGQIKSVQCLHRTQRSN